MLVFLKSGLHFFFSPFGANFFILWMRGLISSSPVFVYQYVIALRPSHVWDRSWSQNLHKNRLRCLLFSPFKLEKRRTSSFLLKPSYLRFWNSIRYFNPIQTAQFIMRQGTVYFSETSIYLCSHLIEVSWSWYREAKQVWWNLELAFKSETIFPFISLYYWWKKRIRLNLIGLWN